MGVEKISTRRRPLIHRKASAAGVLFAGLKGVAIYCSEHLLANGPAAFQHACGLGLESIVFKLAQVPHAAKQRQVTFPLGPLFHVGQERQPAFPRHCRENLSQLLAGRHSGIPMRAPALSRHN